MKKIAFMFVGMGMASAFAGASTHFADSNCASPKFFPGNICDTMSILADSARMIFDIVLTPTVPDSENSPTYLAKVKVWSESLFTEYDLRNFRDTMTRLPVPPDSELSWGYGFIIMTKATALALVNESYVYRLEFRSSPSTSIYTVNAGPSRQGKKSSEARFDALGRGILPVNRSMNSFIKHPPKR